MFRSGNQFKQPQTISNNLPSIIQFLRFRAGERIGRGLQLRKTAPFAVRFAASGKELMSPDLGVSFPDQRPDQVHFFAVIRKMFLRILAGAIGFEIGDNPFLYLITGSVLGFVE